ncbi:hypothetical protein H6P87_00395 [Rickettsia tillamookensis]|uniref:Secreted protein n=1 Tax=Rickettsia tillamookensis TaxID=2761623 RepID=A0A9E6MH11_9RICK|nr:hypothetical protein H6P87_00395 [Rickettsia tillamookensis]
MKLILIHKLLSVMSFPQNIIAWVLNRHCERALLRGTIFRHCEKNYTVIRRSNPVKNSDLQNFFIIFAGLPRRFAPRNDDGE